MKTLVQAAVLWFPISCVHAGPCDGLERCDTLVLFTGGTEVGRLIECFHEPPGGALVETSALDARIPSGNGASEARISIEETRSYDSSGALDSATQRITSISGQTQWKLYKDGSQWHLVTIVAGQRSVRDLPDYRGERIDTFCRLYRGLLDGTVAVGDTWVDTGIEMTSGRPVATRIECTGRPESDGDSTWRFMLHDELSGRDERWVVSRSGRTLLRSVPPVFEARAEGYQPLPHAGMAANSGMSLEEVFRVPAERAARPNERIVVRLRDAELPESGHQFFSQRDSVWVLRPPLTDCPSSETRGQAVQRGKAHIGSTPTLQVDHPRIKALADTLRRGREQVCAFAADATRHVYRRLRRRTTPTFSSALETLEAGYGDCGEHAVLLAAVLRAGGVPARVVLGLVYIADRKAYLGHAWVGIRLEQGWVFADPAFGRFPAAQGLVPLLVDDTGRDAVAVLRLLDRVDIGYEKAAGAAGR